MKTKKCNQCNEIKNISFFYSQQQKSETSNAIWHYYDSRCKECRSTTTTKRRQNIKKQCIEYKGNKCVHCNLDDPEHPEIYDFHHLEPNKKDFTIGKTIKKFESLKKELDKCILLCANCHRKIHKKL